MMRSVQPVLARQFVASSSQHLILTSSVVSAVPLSMACWFNTTTPASAQALISVGRSTLEHSHTLWAGRTGALTVASVSSQAGAGAAYADSTVAFPQNTWAHAAGVWSANNSRTVYLNAGNSATSTTTVTPTSLVRTRVGRGNDGLAEKYHTGYIAWPAIWNIALSEPDIARLASGVPPWLVRPEGLISFWGFSGVDLEPSQGLYGNSYPLTNSGSTTVSGPSFLHLSNKSQLWLGATSTISGFRSPLSLGIWGRIGSETNTGNRRRRILTGVNY